MEKTIFQKIIDREIPADILYEDETLFVILDINPVKKGHVLVITKYPFIWMDEVPDDVLAKTFIFSKKMIPLLKQATSCDYIQVVVEGIQVPHFHIHLIPSFKEVQNATWEHVSYEDSEREMFVKKIKEFLV